MVKAVDIKVISTDSVSPPGGHYSQAVIAGDLIFVSGQLPIAAAGVKEPRSGFEAQARQALGNLLEILKAAGSTPGRLIKVTAYIVGVENWPAFNRIYAELLADVRPARSVVPVPALHHGYLVEVEAIAVDAKV